MSDLVMVKLTDAKFEEDGIRGLVVPAEIDEDGDAYISPSWREQNAADTFSYAFMGEYELVTAEDVDASVKSTKQKISVPEVESYTVVITVDDITDLLSLTEAIQAYSTIDSDGMSIISNIKE